MFSAHVMLAGPEVAGAEVAGAATEAPKSGLASERLLSMLEEVATVSEWNAGMIWRAAFGILVAYLLVVLLVRIVAMVGARWSRTPTSFRLWLVASLVSASGLSLVWGLVPITRAAPIACSVLAAALLVFAGWGRINFLRAGLQGILFVARAAPVPGQPVRWSGKKGFFESSGLFSSLLRFEAGSQRVWNDELGAGKLEALGPPHSTTVHVEVELPMGDSDRLVRDLHMIALLSPFRIASSHVHLQLSGGDLRLLQVGIVTWATQESAHVQRALLRAFEAYLSTANSQGGKS